MVNEYENSLRRLICDVIGSDDNANYGISEDRIQKWREKRAIEAKKRSGKNFEPRMIYYSDIYDLKNIISKNWEKFRPILVNKKRFGIFFDEIESFRNTISHGRNLNSGEENLLSGIISDLKNQITVYHNKNEMKEDYFIRIIQISDNLGNVWEKTNPSKKPILRVGDEYEILVEANDPKNRIIEYKFWMLSHPNFRQYNKNGRFSIKIDIDMVGESQTFYITVGTPSSEYKNEATKSIRLIILPS